MAVGKGPDIPEYNDDPLLQWSVAMFVASLLLWVGSGFAVIILNSKLKHTHSTMYWSTSLILIFRFSLKWRTEENVNHCLENWEGKINALVWVVLINEAQFKGPYHPFPSTKKRENVGIFHIVFKSVSQHNCRNQAGSPFYKQKDAKVIENLWKTSHCNLNVNLFSKGDFQTLWRWKWRFISQNYNCWIHNGFHSLKRQLAAL